MIAMGPFNPQLITPDFSIVRTVFQSPGLQTQICQSNQNRVALILACSGAGVWRVDLNEPPNGNLGIEISSNETTVYLTFRDFGAIVTFPWFGTDGGIGEPLTVYEVIYTPNRQSKRK